jgi:hypothetical protein
MRAIKDYDFLNVTDRLLADVFVGTNTVKDTGSLDEDGVFTPDADDPAILVRAVRLQLISS